MNAGTKLLRNGMWAVGYGLMVLMVLGIVLSILPSAQPVNEAHGGWLTVVFSFVLWMGVPAGVCMWIGDAIDETAE